MLERNQQWQPLNTKIRGLCKIALSTSRWKVDEDDKTNLELGLAGGAPIFVNESGMYTVIKREKNDGTWAQNYADVNTLEL